MLRGKKEIEAIVGLAYNKMAEDCKAYGEVNNTAFTGTVEEVMNKVSGVLSSVSSLVKGADACLGDAKLPKFLFSFTGYEGNGTIVEIDLTVKTKLKAVNPYKTIVRIAIDEKLIENIAETFMSAIVNIFYMELAEDNISVLNEKVEALTVYEELPFEFKFVLCNKGLVSEITDTKVLFNIPLDQALDIQRLPIFSNGTEYSDICAEEYAGTLIAGLKAVQTTVQLMKAPIKLIQTVCDSKTKKRADILIRQTYHKQAKFLANTKAGVGYVEESVEIDGQEVNLFSLVKKSGGEYTVVLAPFDIELLVNVDYDALTGLGTTEPVGVEEVTA